jgi:hypothetical protein
MNAGARMKCACWPTGMRERNAGSSLVATVARIPRDCSIVSPRRPRKTALIHVDGCVPPLGLVAPRPHSQGQLP